MTKEVRIKNRIIGDGHPCFIVAEIGCNHDGKLKQAKEMIDAAVDAGCDAVKFQSFSANKLFNEYFDYAKKGVRKDWIKFLKSLELKKEWHKLLKDYCERKGIIFLSSVCDEEKADWLERLSVPAFKVPSYELIHLPLLKYIAQKKKPVILSSGIGVEKEIEEAIRTIYKEGNKEVVLMHCVSAYPCRSEDLNLKTIPYYKKRFGVPVGLSDHSLGILSSLAGVAMGANIVEKHITPNKKLPNPDHHFALDFKEMKEWVSGIREVEKSLGKIKRTPAQGEKDQVLWRRALWAKKDIEKGERIKNDSLMIVRPSPKGTLAPKTIYNVLGKKAKKKIRKGEAITLDKLV